MKRELVCWYVEWKPNEKGELTPRRSYRYADRRDDLPAASPSAKRETVERGVRADAPTQGSLL